MHRIAEKSSFMAALPAEATETMAKEEAEQMLMLDQVTDVIAAMEQRVVPKNKPIPTHYDCICCKKLLSCTEHIPAVLPLA